MPDTTPYLPAALAEFDVDEIDAGFFDACLEHRLSIQRCQTCSTFQHPPREACSTCRSFDLAWQQIPGTGTIYTYTIAHHPIGPVRDYVPYTVIAVDLDGTGGARLVSNLVDPPEAVQIGAAVEVVWDEMTSERTLPRFRLRDESSASSGSHVR
jgi:uncharacterized OB-fold protein